MSSMLKKTGGLAFKPKAGRRGGAGPAATASPSQAPSAPASGSASVAASETGTPVPEPSTQTSTPTTSTPAPVPVPTPALTPAPAPAPTSTVAPSTEVTNTTPSSIQEHRKVIGRADQSTVQPQTIAAPQLAPESTIPPSNSAIKPIAETSSIPTENDTTRHAQQTPAPEVTTSNIPPVPAVSGPSAAAPAPALPPAPTPAALVSTSAPVPAHNVSVAPTISVAQNSATRTQTAPTATAARLPTAPPSPPAPDTITAVAPPDGSSSTTAAPKKKRAPRKRTAPSADGEVEGGESAPPKKKRTYRKRQPSAAEEGEVPAAAAATEGGEEAPQPKKTPRPRKRAPTPEDPENQEVDHSTTKMAELTRDLGIGKPFKHADAIAERHRLTRLAAKQRKLDKQKRAMGLIPDGEADTNSRSGTPSAGNTGEGGVSRNGTDMAAMGGIDTGAGVGYEVVDGQIVVNQSSLVVDRHAGQETQNLETVEEDEFSHQTTAASYRRPSRNVANAWTEAETERFYRLLSMFGTDFETIAAMFPGKNRRMVKCKFNREERLRPKRINATVMVRGSKLVPIDLDEYKGFQKQWQEPEDILREHERLAEEHRRDIQRLKAERRAQGLADDSDEAEGEGGVEAGGGADGVQGDGVVDAAAAIDGEGGNAAAMSVEMEVAG